MYGIDAIIKESSTHLFSVVDFPDEGFPTKPMRGSRILAHRCRSFCTDDTQVLDNFSVLCGLRECRGPSSVVIDKRT